MYFENNQSIVTVEQELREG